MKPRVSTTAPPNLDTSVQLPVEVPAAEVKCEVLVLHITQEELRTLLRGAGILAVRTSTFLAWAGTANPTEVSLPRWRRPYVSDESLVRYIAALEVRSVAVARELARGFGLEVEQFLLARAFNWLRRIRAVHLDDPRWKRLDIPAARISWRLGTGGDGPGTL
jgi:hypothetical protein